MSSFEVIHDWAHGQPNTITMELGDVPSDAEVRAHVRTYPRLERVDDTEQTVTHDSGETWTVEFPKYVPKHVSNDPGNYVIRVTGTGENPLWYGDIRINVQVQKAGEL